MNLPLRPLASLAAGLVAVAGTGLAAQDDALAEKRDKKLQSEFLQLHGWTTDYDAARERAKQSGKPIFAYFTRSYAP